MKEFEILCGNCPGSHRKSDFESRGFQRLRNQFGAEMSDTFLYGQKACMSDSFRPIMLDEALHRRQRLGDLTRTHEASWLNSHEAKLKEPSKIPSWC